MTTETSTETPSQPSAAEESDASAVAVQDAQLPEAAEAAVSAPAGQIEILLDALMTVTAMVGQAELPVRDLLQLGPGSVLKLDRRKGQPIDLYLRGVKFATGQLVVVGENLGVRINQILAPPKAM
ncbi:MAG: FliM/FliN family flagellar motor switch protein [Planctomycetaceae bacterium]|nr:FliM/FliN family flagellar motor switch protein [Planctomycetaceae bacterium]